MQVHVYRCSTHQLSSRTLPASLTLFCKQRPEKIMSAKARTAVDETANGEFKRTDAGFRNYIAPDTEFPPEKGACCDFDFFMNLAGCAVCIWRQSAAVTVQPGHDKRGAKQLCLA